MTAYIPPQVLKVNKVHLAQVNWLYTPLLGCYVNKVFSCDLRRFFPSKKGIFMAIRKTLYRNRYLAVKYCKRMDFEHYISISIGNLIKQDKRRNKIMMSMY